MGDFMTKSLLYVSFCTVLALVFATCGFAAGGITFGVESDNSGDTATDDTTTYAISYKEMKQNSSGEWVSTDLPAEEIASFPTSYTTADLPLYIDGISRVGYEFAGWYFDNINYLDYDEDLGKYVIPENSTGDLTVYADFSPIEYSINFENLPEGAIIDDQYRTYTIEDNVDFSQIIPEIYGYEFLGWYRDSDLTVPASNITAGTTGNVTVYASYREIVVTIHFSEQFDDITVAFESMAYGTSGVLNDIVPTREGYTFGGWYTSEDFSTRSYIDPNRPYYFTKDVTLYAKWDAKANPAIIWISVAFAALAVIGFVLWWILFRPRYKE